MRIEGEYALTKRGQQWTWLLGSGIWLERAVFEMDKFSSYLSRREALLNWVNLYFYEYHFSFLKLISISKNYK